jgi:uncharacterized RDD family membrane protein YckC
MSDQAIHIPVGLTTDGLLGKRYIARIIDTVILSVLVVFLTVAVGAIWSQGINGNGFLSVIVAAIFIIGYGTALEASRWQATIGKRLMRIRVYTLDGGRPSLLQAAERNLIKDGPFVVLSVLPYARGFSLIWLIAHIVVLHRSSVYQAIHDHAARTWAAAPEETIQLHLT